MRLWEQKQLHAGVLPWYYGAMTQRGLGLPESMIRCIRRWLVCRRQILRLKEALTETRGEADFERSEMKRDVIDALSLHFRCLEEQVTCSRVKPFLPSLLIPSLRIRIPTPITVHLDHCTECAEDLAALQDLALDDEQLDRLEQLYEQASPVDSRQCRRARSRIPAFVRGDFEEISADLLDHLCLCPGCRARVYESRQRLLESVRARGDGAAAACREDIPTTQLFDYAVPYGGGIATGERADDSHVRTCPDCLKRIQILDETLYGIAERTDSGVATVYRTAENPRPSAGAMADPYLQYPIDVQVIRGAPEPAVVPVPAPAGIKVALQRSSCNPQVRFLLKTAVAAAAVIPLAFLFHYTYTASGITLGQVRKAFGGTDNICAVKVDAETGVVIQEVRVSRKMDVAVTIQEAGYLVYDLGAKQRRSVQWDSGRTDTLSLSEQDCATVREWMNKALGFAPSDIPSRAPWREITREVPAGQAVYELTWTSKTLRGGDAFYKWEITLDVETKLPVEIREFQGTYSQERWWPVSIQTFQYLSPEQMAAELSAWLDAR